MAFWILPYTGVDIMPHVALNLDETRRKFPESIKEGKQEESGIEDYKNNNKNGNRKEYSQIESGWYSIYLKRFLVHHHPYRSLTSYR